MRMHCPTFKRSGNLKILNSQTILHFVNVQLCPLKTSFDESNGIEKTLNKLLKGSKSSVLKNACATLPMYSIKNIDDSHFKTLTAYFDLVKLKVKDKLA